MKIRTDYVTNSSTTSYIIICGGSLSRADLSRIMGIPKGSPLYPLVDSLYDSIQRTKQSAQSARMDDPKFGDSQEDFMKGRFSDKVWEKVVQAEQQRKEIGVGHLSSGETPAESLFCCDSFEWEDEKVYINALNCVW